MFQGSFKGVYIKFLQCFKEVSRVFQGTQNKKKKFIKWVVKYLVNECWLLSNDNQIIFSWVAAGCVQVLRIPINHFPLIKIFNCKVTLNSKPRLEANPAFPPFLVLSEERVQVLYKHFSQIVDPPEIDIISMASDPSWM